MAEKISTIKVLGKATREIRCPYNCDGGDVTIDPNTGKCKICKRVFNIEETEFTYDDIVLPFDNDNSR